MPEVGKNIFKFKEYNKQLIAPYFLYADFEAILKVETESITSHEISRYSLCIVSPYEETHSESYRGEDAGEVFLKRVQGLSSELFNKIKRADAPMVYTDDDKKNFQNAKICHICNKSLPKNSTKIDLLAQIQKWLEL